MLKFSLNLLLVFLFASPYGLNTVGTVFAETETEPEPADPSEDAVIEEEDDDDDDDDDEALVEETQTGDNHDSDDLDENSQATDVTSHPDADTTIIFVTGEDLPANEIVKFLVGFTNKGSQDFTVQSLEASFRYPQDYQFFIQNFTALSLDTVIKPNKQASFEYSFIPAQPMAGRPFGLVILLHYHDSEGNAFQSAVYNQTVTITEVDEGLDGETMFMYIFLGGLVVLVLFGMYQVLESRTKKRVPVKIEKGTGGLNDVDISWIPPETLNIMNKRASPRASPRKRVTRSAGTTDQ